MAFTAEVVVVIVEYGLVVSGQGIAPGASLPKSNVFDRPVATFRDAVRLAIVPPLMDEALAQTLAALTLALRLSLPVCGAALGVAIVVSLLQGWSRLHEPVIAAIPRALVTLLVLGASASYVGRELVGYTAALFRALPELVR